MNLNFISDNLCLPSVVTLPFLRITNIARKKIQMHTLLIISNLCTDESIFFSAVLRLRHKTTMTEAVREAMCKSSLCVLYKSFRDTRFYQTKRTIFCTKI